VVVAGHDAAVDLARSSPGVLPVVVGGDLSCTALSVGVDQVAGATAAVEYFIGLGHRSIARRWPTRLGRGPRPCRRLAVGDVRGRPGDERASGGDWGAVSGYEAGRALAADDAVTAVFAGNDQMALGVLRALHEAGRLVPDEVSVVGFDDIPEAGLPHPTTDDDPPALHRCRGPRHRGPRRRDPRRGHRPGPALAATPGHPRVHCTMPKRTMR